MQVLYALPFLLLSGIGGLVCLAVPRWRGYFVAAAVGPVAFGFWSVVSMGAIMLASDYAGWPDLALEHQGILMLLPIYVLPGAFGAWLSVVFAKAILRRLLIALGWDHEGELLSKP
jgi:hypothetical protein